ncbi:Tyrosine decarboxylase [Lachnellula willkommii]|uniref:Tyrosine decarboxylase n=1 Tax=Lachnellula willkommii TaxID=215461 RepID=A0A559MK47_9HELO|nr:Tyrosine decarboxylase [Lachnellula willkommii]
MDSKQFKEAAASAIDEIVNYYDTIEDRRVVSNVEPGYLKKLLPEGPPQDGESWADIQKDMETKIMPGLTHWQSPNFMAFFPASSSFPGMLGELYSAAFTAPAFNWICSPAITELETVVLDWLAKLLNLPDCYLSTSHGGGVIQGSASEAIVTSMVAARDKYLRETTSHLSGLELEDAIAHKRMCPEFQHLTAEFEHFHSFDMNMHKWLLTNFDASCLFVRKRKDLIDALSIMPSYLRNEFSDSGLVTDYRDWQIPLGRRFRSLKIWFVLRTYGVNGLQAHIRKHIKYGEVFAGLIKSRPDIFDMISGPNFALTVFKIATKSGGKPEQDKLTKEVYELSNKRGEIFLTSGVVEGDYAIRVVSANPLAEERFLHKAFKILVATTEEVRDGKTVENGINGVLKDYKGVGDVAIEKENGVTV